MGGEKRYDKMNCGRQPKKGMEMETQKGRPCVEEELLLAVKFLIYFAVSVVARKSRIDVIVGLNMAFDATDGYLKEEMKQKFPFL